jgi:hypothetical protein
MVPTISERVYESGLYRRPGRSAIGLVMPLPIRFALLASLPVHRRVTFGAAWCTLSVSILTCLEFIGSNPADGCARARGIAGV